MVAATVRQSQICQIVSASVCTWADVLQGCAVASVRIKRQSAAAEEARTYPETALVGEASITLCDADLEDRRL